jgi:putative addiction module killer protein
MEVKERKIKILTLPNGKSPFVEWLETLRDKSLRLAVDSRLTRIWDGNFGDHKSLGEGLFELRINKGPGLRIYYVLEDDEIVLLLGGGDKRTQIRDIHKAKKIWKEHKK